MKDLKLYIFIASTLLIIYLIAQYNKPKPINWTETFNNIDKIPFGTYVLYNRLHDIFPNAIITPFREPLYNVITDHHVKNGTYIIICNAVNLNEYDYDKLNQYVKNGNEVFIAASQFGGYLQKMLKVETGYELRTYPGNIGFLNTNPGDSNKYFIDKNSTQGYFSKFDTSKALVLGQNAFHHSNFIKFNIGRGSLYLNANPLMFTNYSILQKQGSAYAAIALSNLKSNKSLIWDEFYSQGRDAEESSMRVFLRNPALRWAFYISFFSLLIFVIYEMKRRQRIIPVINPLNNTSVGFAKVVGQVYYEQRNNANIAQKKVTYFLEDIRTQYYVKTNVLDDEFIKILSQKSGAKSSLIQQLFYQIALVRSGQHINDNELITLNQNIEQFYLQTR